MSPAQRRRRQCGAMQEYERLLEEQPSFRANQERSEEFTARAISTGEALRVARRVIRIPVVVHVVYGRDRENISKSQINSQITALNRDFRATNADVSQVPDAWKGLVLDSKIEFALASRDPDGKPTDGVTRTKTERAQFGTGDDVKTKAGGGAP
ncbi:MAG: M43 family zinc metalloprotease, partial [Solirubrobacterales bacterium]